MLRRKICGLTRSNEISFINTLVSEGNAPDYIGFVFYEKSKRYVNPETAATFRRQLHPSVQAVGVFVNAPIPYIQLLVEQGTIQVVQLHGQEDAHYLSELRNSIPNNTPIWQAFGIHDAADISRANASGADLVLLDHGAGGTGECFDWSLLKNIQKPFFLAGGLTPENVADAISQCHPYGVDTSSGVETDRRKDPEKIKTFLAACKKAIES